MKLNLNRFLFSVSFALDLAETQILQVSKLHSKRVAFISLQIGQVLGFSDEQQFDLYAYALMHDNGLIESYSNQKGREAFTRSLYVEENFHDHCIIGEENIRHFPFLTQQENIILYHHERYDGKGFFGKKGDEIPLMSQILYCANVIDEVIDLGNITLTTKSQIEAFVKAEEGNHFSPEIVKAFTELSSSFRFWGSLEYFHMINRPEKLLKNFELEITLDQFYDMVQIFSKIVDSKSHFTALHSEEIVEKTGIVLDHYQFDECHKKKIQIAAYLHDIGKMATPVEILEKPGPLTPEEVFEIKKHAYFTFMILDGIDFSPDILNWASQHHEKPDGSGYPFGLCSDDLSMEARLVSCLDFYQALVEKRPYREAMKHDDAIGLMMASLREDEADITMVKMIDRVFAPSSF